jgi:DNA-directed RNA polymerase specialized sigma subunit
MSHAYRIDIKVRNNLILEKIEKAGYSGIADFCRDNKISRRLYNIVNMQMSPIDTQGLFHSCVAKTADVLNCSVDDLFTESQLDALLQTNKRTLLVHEAEAKFMVGKSDIPLLPEDIITAEKLNENIEKALETLTQREAKVIRLRFALDDRVYTCKEIAEMEGVTPARILQIEATALRKLRHSSRTDILLDHIR